MHHNRIGLAAGRPTFFVGTSPAHRARSADDAPSPARLVPLDTNKLLLHPPRPRL
jgi:hypothetical protein